MKQNIYATLQQKIELDQQDILVYDFKFIPGYRGLTSISLKSYIFKNSRNILLKTYIDIYVLIMSLLFYILDISRFIERFDLHIRLNLPIYQWYVP